MSFELTNYEALGEDEINDNIFADHVYFSNELNVKTNLKEVWQKVEDNFYRIVEQTISQTTNPEGILFTLFVCLPSRELEVYELHHDFKTGEEEGGAGYYTINNLEIKEKFYIKLIVTTTLKIPYDTKEAIQEEQCVVCLDAPPKVLYVECLHYIVCKSCDDTGNFNRCPKCRKPIENKIRF